MIERYKLPWGCEEVLKYLESSYPMEDGKVIIDRFACERVEKDIFLTYDRSCSVIASLMQFKLADFSPETKGETFLEKLTGRL